jgi:hypothetical protein
MPGEMLLPGCDRTRPSRIRIKLSDVRWGEHLATNQTGGTSGDKCQEQVKWGVARSSMIDTTSADRVLGTRLFADLVDMT